MSVVSSLGEISGTPVIDREVCTRCGDCTEVCPTGVLTMDADDVRIDSSAAFGCIACGQCMMVCTTNAVRVTGRGLSPDDLLPLPPPEARATPDQLEALFRARRSVRRFQDRLVPPELLDRVVVAATTAPMGIPPSEVGVVVLSGHERVGALSRDAAKIYEGMLKFLDRPWLWGLLRPFVKRAVVQQFQSFILPLGRGIVAAAKRGEDKVLYGAPAALLFYTSPYADTSDAAITCTYAMIAAESLGLGSCMIGCVAPVLAWNRKIAAKYGIPAGHTPALVLILGYSAIAYERTVRRSLLSVKRL